MSKKHSSLVYSTETGRLCPECEQAMAACICKQEDAPKGDGIVRVSLDTKGRKGKGVTLISGLMLSSEELKTLAKELKQKCSVGGAVKEGNIEIQGDHRDRIVEILQTKSFKVKRSGG
jgi:translation initiation factor 1